MNNEYIKNDKDNTPLVSVVVPVYKTENYIANTIRSLCNQTFADFEVVFVDDGSPDGSVQVIEKELQGKSIKYSIVHQKNSGQGITRNTGVKHANGEWVLFLDSDDVLQPCTLELYVKALEREPSAEFLFSKFQNVNEETLFMEAPKSESVTYVTKEDLLHGFLTRKITILVPGSLYKVSTLKEKDIWHSFIRWSEDQHFLWRVLDNTQGGVFVETCLYNYLQRSTNGSIMTSTPIDSMLIAYKEFIKMAESMSNNEVKKFLLSRWVLGCLNVLARRKDKRAWRAFFEETNGKGHLKTLCSFPEWKVRTLARLGRISKSLMYMAMKTLG